MTLGLTNGTINAGLSNSPATNKLQADRNAYGRNVQSSNIGEGNSTGIFGITTDPAKSGLIAKISGLTIPSEKLGSFYIRY